MTCLQPILRIVGPYSWGSKNGAQDLLAQDVGSSQGSRVPGSSVSQEALC